MWKTRITFLGKIRKKTLLKLYKVMGIPTVLHIRMLNFDNAKLTQQNQQNVFSESSDWILVH
jgi:hypothetical protein